MDGNKGMPLWEGGTAWSFVRIPNVLRIEERHIIQVLRERTSNCDCCKLNHARNKTTSRR